MTGSAIDVIERAYQLDAPTPEWLESVRSTAERVFSGQLAATAYAFRLSVDGAFSPLHVTGPLDLRESFHLFHSLTGPETLRKVYLGGPVPSLCAILPTPMANAGYAAAAPPFGFEEVWGTIGMDPSGLGCALAFPSTNRSRLPRPTRRALERIAAHLGSALRLRERLTKRGIGVWSEVDAVLGPDRSVLHAEHDARDADARLALREAARRMDRARLRSERRNNETALGLWRALVDGRWALAEAFESDGRRVLIARRNDPTTRKDKALSPLERKVVAFLAVGHSLKLCAYELGRAQSTIHALAAAAMSKLRVRSRAELVELHGALVPSDEAKAPSRS